jgi:hypothetical protein
MKKIAIVLGIMAAILVITSISFAGAEMGKADGQLIVDKKPVKLAFAYAFAQPGFFDKSTEDVKVLLTDVSLEGKALDDEFERINLVKSGKLHCIEIVIDAKKQPISVTIRHPSFKITESGGSTEDVFEAKTFDGKKIEGRAFRKSPGKSFDDLEFTYDVNFNAPIVKKGK